jgi:hypothetical protein
MKYKTTDDQPSPIQSSPLWNLVDAPKLWVEMLPAAVNYQ